MNNQNWQNGWGTMYQPQFTTNVSYVTSIEEALMRSSQRNSEYVHFHQDKPVFFRVKVDPEGKKMWQSFEYIAPNPEANLPATKADLTNIYERLARLELNLPKQEVSHGESDGQNTVC